MRTRQTSDDEKSVKVNFQKLLGSYDTFATQIVWWLIKPDIGDSQLVIDYRQESSNRHSRTGFLMQRLSILHCKYRWHQLHMAWGKGQVPLPPFTNCRSQGHSQ